MVQAGKTFRIFVSSTFSDLKEERNALQVIEGLSDVQAIAAGFHFRAIARATETVIKETTGRLVALFPLALDHLTTHRSGRLWIGASANHLYFVALEGGPVS